MFWHSGFSGNFAKKLGIPTRDVYLEIFEGDTASVNAHLAVLAHVRGNLEARANYNQTTPGRQAKRSFRDLNEKNIKINHKFLNISPKSEIFFVPLRYRRKERTRYE